MATLKQRLAIVWNDGVASMIHVSAMPDALEELKRLDGVESVESRGNGIYAVFLSLLYDRQSIIDDIEKLAPLPEIDPVWKDA